MRPSDYRPPWVRTDDLKRQIGTLTDRVIAARIIAREIVEGQQAKAELARLMLKPCKSCGASAIEQVRGRSGRGDPSWIRSDTRISCSVCNNATGWHKHELVHHARSLWNNHHGLDGVAATPARRVEVVMTPKLQALAGKLRDVTTNVEARASKIIDRLEKTDQTSAGSADRIHAELDKLDAASRQVEDLVNQMSNGGPPLSDSVSSSGS